ncbi:hypothetical protein ACJMK2_032699 [Sinanodonta woodiana]|uniref:NTR domain-containing protein n=1 Tax=Sinanodonta woodiana TaxID=1069815 RepID=A0ABD3X627_SINWO
MERHVQFLPSIFVLLVASYVANACSCMRLTLEQSLCPEYNKTVLMANFKNTKETNLDTYGNATTDPNAPNGRYDMNLEQSFKNGTILLDTDNGGFFMYFPRLDSHCGRRFNKTDSYLFVGSVDSMGDFCSNSCEVVISKADVVSNSTIMDLLQGNQPRNCAHL